MTFNVPFMTSFRLFEMFGLKSEDLKETQYGTSSITRFWTLDVDGAEQGGVPRYLRTVNAVDAPVLAQPIRIKNIAPSTLQRGQKMPRDSTLRRC